tara:strand:- start:247 stop:1017 length:771 start_codon:yes stop_codon:yes gene_type:complete
MKLGFIGVGNITSDVINGIFKSKLKNCKIILSSRNKIKSKQLKKKYKKIIIANSNQEVINKSDIVFLGVLPEVGRKILPYLKFKSKQTVVSFISTIKYKELKKIISKNVSITRVIPMPPISLAKGPVPIYPPNKKIKNFFENIGTVIEIKNEKLSTNFWAISGTMASYYELIKVLSDWLVKRGVKREISQKYVTSLYSALSDLAFSNSKTNLVKFVKNSQTPGGLNWQGVNELRHSGYFKSLEKSVNNILKRLNKK